MVYKPLYTVYMCAQEVAILTNIPYCNIINKFVDQKNPICPGVRGEGYFLLKSLFGGLQGVLMEKLPIMYLYMYYHYLEDVLKDLLSS